MKKNILFFIILNSIFSYSQKKDFEIYQYEKLDSLNGHISKIVKFNKKGLKKSEELIDYKTSSVDGVGDYLDFYHYEDTLIIRRETIFRDSDNKRLLKNFYNKKGLLEKQHFQSYKRRIKKNIKKGIGYDSCIITEDDYDTKPSWKTDSEIFFTYNKLSQKTEYYAPKIHWDNQNRYKYEYNTTGRLSKKISYTNNKILYEEFINYKDDIEEHKLLWHNENQIEPRVFFIQKYKDDDGRIVKIEQKDDKNNLEFLIIKAYNKNNDLLSEKRFDSEKKLEITHKYIYK